MVEKMVRNGEPEKFLKKSCVVENWWKIWRKWVVIDLLLEELMKEFDKTISNYMG